MSTIVELRCPSGPNELLMKMRREGEKPQWDTDMNACLLKCSWCTRQARKQDPNVLRVIHAFWVNGELCDTEIEYR